MSICGLTDWCREAPSPGRPGVSMRHRRGKRALCRCPYCVKPLGRAFKDQQPRDKGARVLEGGGVGGGASFGDCLASCGLETSILGVAEQDHFRGTHGLSLRSPPAYAGPPFTTGSWTTKAAWWTSPGTGGSPFSSSLTETAWSL